MVKFTARIIVVLSVGALAGCSATSLRCGIDGESTFVELINVPQDYTSQSRHFRDLCAFAYEPPAENRPVAELNIIEPALLQADGR